MIKVLNILCFLISNIYSKWEKILTAIGNIKIFKTPCFIIYDPNEYDYKIRGHVIRKLESGILKPGDIILRKYDHYLDGFFIPGEYSHSSIYMGNGLVMHAVAEGVKEIDLIDFCQCDGLKILRCNNKDVDINEVLSLAEINKDKPYDFKFDSNDSSSFYCHEFTRACYKSLEIESYIPTFLGIKIKFLSKKFLDKSFIDNPYFDTVITV